MNRFVLCGLVLASCLAVVLGEMCTPDQWEGFEGSTGGYVEHRRVGIIKEWARLSYDAKNKRTASFINYVNNDYENKFQVVARYGDDGDDSGRIYVVNIKKDKCWSKKLDRPFKKACLPADAKSIGDHYMGLKGKGGLLVSMYSVDRRHVSSYLSVSKLGDAIIPIGESVYGSVMRTKFIQPMGYLDITPGIQNATVFDIPKQCTEVEDMSVSEYLMKEHLILGF